MRLTGTVTAYWLICWPSVTVSVYAAGTSSAVNVPSSPGRTMTGSADTKTPAASESAAGAKAAETFVRGCPVLSPGAHVTVVRVRAMSAPRPRYCR